MKASFDSQVFALTLLLLAAPARADWRAGNADAEAAAKDPRIAAVLAATVTIDRATITPDPAAFAALLADDLAVNNPLNSVSVRGGTAQRSAAGQIRYTRYERVIEYAALRGEMVLLMGEETVVPVVDGPVPAREAHRRFTDLWKLVDGRWLLTARQATLITRP